MALIEWLLAALLFLLTAGFLFYDRFKHNKALMAGAIVLAITGTIGSIYLMREWIQDIVDARIPHQPTSQSREPQGPTDPSDAGTLHPTIKRYVDLAEAAEKEARKVVIEARPVELEIRAVISRANSAASQWGWTKLPMTIKWGGQDIIGEYRGETTTAKGTKIAHGLGAFQAEKMGYTGQWANGTFDGYGELSFARTGNNLGKWNNGQAVPIGYFFREGRKVSVGKSLNGVDIGVNKTDFAWTPDDPEAEAAGQLSCPGPCYRVQYMVDKTRFAGQFDGDQRSIGALFGAEGELVSQGYWKDGQFIYPIR